MNPYRVATHVVLGMAGACGLLVIWRPVGTWWQWLATGVLLVLVAAGTSNAADGQADR